MHEMPMTAPPMASRPFRQTGPSNSVRSSPSTVTIVKCSSVQEISPRILSAVAVPTPPPHRRAGSLRRRCRSWRSAAARRDRSGTVPSGAARRGRSSWHRLRGSTLLGAEVRKVEHARAQCFRPEEIGEGFEDAGASGLLVEGPHLIGVDIGDEADESTLFLPVVRVVVDLLDELGGSESGTAQSGFAPERAL